MKIKRLVSILLIFAISLSCGFTNVYAASEKIDSEQSEGLSQKQLNSLSMLNYLTVLSQEINSSQNNKLYLESVYSSIVNNTNPSSVDPDSKSQIDQLLNTIHGYVMIDEKRDRIQYIYEQNQASAMLKAIPNPIGLLSLVSSDNKAELITSAIYMAVDSVTNYKVAASEADLKYLEDNWQLDDDAKNNLHESRKDAFGYMVEMCTKNNIPGSYALNEDSVKKFVEWKVNPNVTRRVEFLKTNEKTYQAYGQYWLVLAQSYYEQGEYRKSWDCIEKYRSLKVDIFKKDHELAKALAIGLVDERKVLTDPAYVARAPEYCQLIIDNIETEDWALRYLVSQTYVDLGALTKDKSYYEKAYEYTKENVNYLIDEQTKNNKVYLAPIKELEVKKGATKAQKEETKAYNKWIKEERKKELPPAYEPLILNCQLLFAIADELKIPKSEKETIDKMLHPNNEPLFLTSTLDDEFRYGTKEDIELVDPVFKGKEVVVPANYLVPGSTLKVTVIDNGTSTVYEDWVLNEVDRNKAASVEKFSAVYSSKSIGKQHYGADAKIEVEIVPPEEYSFNAENFSFKATNYKKYWLYEDCDFVIEK